MNSLHSSMIALPLAALTAGAWLLIFRGIHQSKKPMPVRSECTKRNQPLPGRVRRNSTRF